MRLVTAGGSEVVRVPNEDSAAKRARWLAELSAALDEARAVTNELGALEGPNEVVEICARIEAVALEVQAMRLMRFSGGDRQFDPEWSKDIPWKRSA
jgi:hypothetical protein